MNNNHIKGTVSVISRDSPILMPNLQRNPWNLHLIKIVEEKSNIVILAWRVTWNYAYSPFKHWQI